MFLSTLHKLMSLLIMYFILSIYLYNDICYFITLCNIYLYIDNSKTRLTNEGKENGSYFYNLSIKHMK